MLESILLSIILVLLTITGLLILAFASFFLVPIALVILAIIATLRYVGYTLI